VRDAWRPVRSNLGNEVLGKIRENVSLFMPKTIIVLDFRLTQWYFGRLLFSGKLRHVAGLIFSDVSEIPNNRPFLTHSCKENLKFSYGKIDLGRFHPFLTL
jgi:hypothetical protein